jgi:PAS domain S-box-containing protein
MDMATGETLEPRFDLITRRFSPASVLIQALIFSGTASLLSPSDFTSSYAVQTAHIATTSGYFAAVLLLLMLLGASAFLIVRLRRKIRNEKNPSLQAIVLERTLELKLYRQMLIKAERMANVGSWEHEPKTGRFIWSDQMYRIFGFEPSEIAPDKDARLQLIHKDDHEQFLKLERQSSEDGKAYEIRLRIVRPDGSQGLIQHRVEPEHDENGNLIRRIGTVIDVTDRVANEETFRLMFEQTPYPFMIIDDVGVIDCNPATEKMFGRSKEEMLGYHPGSFSPEFQPDGQKSTEKANIMVETAFKSGFHRFEWMHRLPDGTDFLAEINLSTIRIGDKFRLMVVMHDLRERLREENRVRRIKELETINRLGATLSHEFNTPLAVIRLSAEMMALKTGDNPEVREQLNKIFTHVARIRELVDKMHQIRELQEIDYAAGMQILDLHVKSPDDPSNLTDGEDSDNQTNPVS